MENSDNIPKKGNKQGDVGKKQKPEKKFDTLDPEADIKNPVKKENAELPNSDEKPIGNKTMDNSEPKTTI